MSLNFYLGGSMAAPVDRTRDRTTYERHDISTVVSSSSSDCSKHQDKRVRRGSADAMGTTEKVNSQGSSILMSGDASAPGNASESPAAAPPGSISTLTPVPPALPTALPPLTVSILEPFIPELINKLEKLLIAFTSAYNKTKEGFWERRNKNALSEIIEGLSLVREAMACGLQNELLKLAAPVVEPHSLTNQKIEDIMALFFANHLQNLIAQGPNHSKALWAATSTGGRPFLYATIQAGLRAFSLSSDQCKRIDAIVKKLMPALVNPIYYGFFEKDHQFFSSLHEITKPDHLKPPSLAPDQRSSWSNFLQAYLSYISDLADKIEAMRID
jgi:hypothetical protein